MAKKTENPECYGAFLKSAQKCRKCEFRKSCAFFKATENKVESLSRLVSIDNTVGEWLVFSEDPVPGEEQQVIDRREELVTALTHVLRWILTLDNYTLGIVSEIIDPKKNGTGGTCVAQLARAHGCTRQSMHQKMLHAVAEYPELATLFQTTLRKVGNLHSQFRKLSEARTK